MVNPGLDQEVALRSEIGRLSLEFAGTFSPETVERYTREALAELQGARVASLIPVLVHCFARERLRALAQVEDKMTKGVPEVLFVCVHNAGRSQMAAALLDALGGGRVHVRSAGSTPASEINPVVVSAMEELGLDLSKEFPKPLTDEVVRAADVVITMGCGDACPIYPGKRYLDWEVPDPAGQPLDAVRAIRADIQRRVEDLLAEMQVERAVLPITPVRGGSMTETNANPTPHWQVWLIGLGDLLRLPSGSVRYFDTVESAQAVARDVGGIVQIEGAPALGGFDRALS